MERNVIRYDFQIELLSIFFGTINDHPYIDTGSLMNLYFHRKVMLQQQKHTKVHHIHPVTDFMDYTLMTMVRDITDKLKFIVNEIIQFIKMLY